MEAEKEERYDSYTEYSSNKGIYDRIKGTISGDFNLFPIHDLGEYTEHRIPIITDCLRLKTYLTEFNTEENCTNTNCCGYINYILNESMRNHNKIRESVFNIYNSYINHHSNININKFCESKISYTDEKKHRKIDKLYTAYRICQDFISNKRLTTSCHYVKSCSTAYNNILTLHPQLDDTKLCKALKDFKIILEANDIISSRNCDSKFSNLLSYPDACDILLQKEQDSAFATQATGELEAQVASEGQSYPPDSSPMREIPGESTISHSTLDPTLPITLFSSGFGVLLILLSLYKFTPLGHWLRLRTHNFKGISEHLDGEKYEMHQHNSEYNEINAEYNGYNISYSSL
ncbi:PIR Superfamily Protein [Plasmodium ovale curtisi]|uniref:PIR Superfamily Protein n=1 Tax=Plasmodium ovale curtisi TaxID=864141 RepID=A0A1A8XGH3_PLAOA|nr:PIR Superfamily Protein [Plasmodium ovale curtisi]SBT03033.1 PIR Superfamily Protein [Plasmodium ovale curtisi]